MQIEETEIPGVLVMRPVPHRDDRGFFTRTFDTALARAHGVELGPAAQDSQSRSGPGVLRGMHGRLGEGETKLVRCARGRVLDVVVDVRPGSATFGRHVATVLDDVEHAHLVVPAGMLHGFQVLDGETADVCYRIDRPHEPAEDVSVRYDDPTLGLPWRGRPTQVSERDLSAGTFAELVDRLAGDHRHRSVSSS